MPPVKILAVTARVLGEGRGEALAAGCDDLISKPISEAKLFDAIARHLNITRENNQPSAQSLLPEVLAQMPQNWQRKLHEAALLGDDEAVYRLVDEIPEEHQTTAKVIRHYAACCNFDPIIDAVSINFQR